MARKRHVCPACRRAFRNVLDYPRVRVLCFERLPVPEAVDTMSEAAARKQLARRRSRPDDKSGLLRDGINLTPVIEKACRTPAVEEYLNRLSKMIDKTTKPRELLPTWPADATFRWAYPIDGSDLYLSLDNADEESGDAPNAEVQIHCDGPNLGSAGGPTLQLLGAIARIGYRGLLAGRSEDKG